jgi:hypothetical protein
MPALLPALEEAQEALGQRLSIENPSAYLPPLSTFDDQGRRRWRRISGRPPLRRSALASPDTGMTVEILLAALHALASEARYASMPGSLDHRA